MAPLWQRGPVQTVIDLLYQQTFNFVVIVGKVLLITLPRLCSYSSVPACYDRVTVGRGTAGPWSRSS